MRDDALPDAAFAGNQNRRVEPSERFDLFAQRLYRRRDACHRRGKRRRSDRLAQGAVFARHPVQLQDLARRLQERLAFAGLDDVRMNELTQSFAALGVAGRLVHKDDRRVRVFVDQLTAKRFRRRVQRRGVDQEPGGVPEREPGERFGRSRFDDADVFDFETATHRRPRTGVPAKNDDRIGRDRRDRTFAGRATLFDGGGEKRAVVVPSLDGRSAEIGSRQTVDGLILLFQRIIRRAAHLSSFSFFRSFNAFANLRASLEYITKTKSTINDFPFPTKPFRSTAKSTRFAFSFRLPGRRALGRKVANLFASGVPSRAPLRRRRHFTTKFRFLTDYKRLNRKILKQIRLEILHAKKRREKLPKNRK